MVAEIEIKGLDEVMDRLKKLETLLLSVTDKYNKRWYSIPEAAEYLGVSEITVRRLITRGLLKRSGALRHVKIPADSLENYRKMSVF